MPMSATTQAARRRGLCTAAHRVTGGDMVAAMDVVGVDGAQLVSPFTIHRYRPQVRAAG